MIISSSRADATVYMKLDRQVDEPGANQRQGEEDLHEPNTFHNRQWYPNKANSGTMFQAGVLDPDQVQTARFAGSVVNWDNSQLYPKRWVWHERRWAE